MKSSTLYRSNLSKEKMMQLEGFKTRNGYQSNISYEENAPSVYVRPKKEKELDTLLGSFNVPTRSEKTPMVYLISGFLVGAVCMFMMTAFVSLSSKEHVVDDSYTVPMEKQSKGFWGLKKKQKTSNVTILPADVAPSVIEVVPKTETYIVKSGDTLAGIIVRFYGSYDDSKISIIAEANKMSNPHSLQIGQKLIIPMD